MSDDERAEILSQLTEQQYADLLFNWREWHARKNQIRPSGDWRYWLVLAGRGFGKTRTGAEAIRELVETTSRIHLIGATAADTRDVMIQGESGLLNCFPPNQRPNYEPSKRLVTFHNGAVAIAFSADEPERLRGPQCGGFWADELAAWRFMDDAWDNLQFGFRLGDDPRGIITTTPKPIKLLKDLIGDPHTVVTRASSYENRSNLAPAFFESIIKKYEGTRLGRQELNAELLEDLPGALWTRKLIDAGRVNTYLQDDIIRMVIAVDPAVSVGEDSAETGIVVAALLRNGHVLILDDLTCKESPLGWANVVIAAFRTRRADRVVGEINNGGDLVERNIMAVDSTIPFRAVRASRGKAVRAEPVAALYEKGFVHHVGAFGALEDEMCGWVPGVTEKSPDRMDALVWAVTELVLDVEMVTTRTQIHPWKQISRY